MPRDRPLSSMAIMVIALLEEQGATHPYELQQVMLSRGDDRYLRLTTGTLYHTVNRLAEQQLIRAVGTQCEGNRPERTAYEATEAGIEALRDRVADLLKTPADEHPVFAVAIAEAHHLPAPLIVELLQRRVEHLSEIEALIDSNLASAEAAGAARRYLLGAHYRKALVTADLTWTRQLIHDIRTEHLEWENK